MSCPRLGTGDLPLPCHDLTMVLPVTTTQASNFCVRSCGFATSTTKHHLPTHARACLHCTRTRACECHSHARARVHALTCTCMHLHAHTPRARACVRVCVHTRVCARACTHTRCINSCVCLVVVAAKPQGRRRGGGGEVNGQAFAASFAGALP